MSISFLFGNLIGRGLTSLLIVWLIWLCVSRFDRRLAWTRTKRWYSLLAVVAMTLLGLGSAVVTAGGMR